MVSQNYAEASVEVLDILNHMNKNDLAKVSRNFIEFLTKNASKEYKCNLDYSKKLNDMQLKKETKSLLAVMYKNYWCSKEEVKKLKEKIYTNQIKHQEELEKKYNSNDIFRNKKIATEKIEDIAINNERSLAIKKENFLTKILNKIKNIFKGRKNGR